jgi:protoporphyrinogen oxidase
MKRVNKSKKVVVLGAGLAGLSAAYELSKKNFSVTVVEKSNQVGGLAQTIRRGDFHFDTGPHRWYTKNDFVNKWMLSLLGQEVIRVPRLTRIYFDKKFFYYPIKLTNALFNIGIIRAVQSVIDYVLARTKARFFKQKLVSMEDGYINQFGKTLYELFFKRYSEKLWGQDCRQISIDWVGQRTRGLNIFTVLKDSLLKNKNVVSLVDEFSYPKMGVGRIAEKMAEEISKNGGKILVRTEVTHINEEKDRIVSVTAKKGKDTLKLTGDYFISSMPLDDLVKRLMLSGKKKNEHILGLAKKLTYRDELLVALFVKKTKITPDTWIYIHPKEIPFMRVMEMDNWSDKLSPRGTTTLVFEIACNVGDDFWRKTDQELIKLVGNAYIKEFHLIKESDILAGFVYRVSKEYPVYHLGYREDVDEIKKYLKKFTNLQLVGRNGTFRYNNMDHSIEMGLYAAWNLIEGKEKYDIESVNIEREYLEEKRIENIEDERLDEK